MDVLVVPNRWPFLPQALSLPQTSVATSVRLYLSQQYSGEQVFYLRFTAGVVNGFDAGLIALTHYVGKNGRQGHGRRPAGLL